MMTDRSVKEDVKGSGGGGGDDECGFGEEVKDGGEGGGLESNLVAETLKGFGINMTAFMGGNARGGGGALD